MSTDFQIHLRTDPEILRTPPPQFAHPRVMYCPICIQLGDKYVPHEIWCDAAGVLLSRWHREVWGMSSGQSRAARLIFFDISREIWVRRTTTRWWKVSGVERGGEEKVIGPEMLCIPEEIEAALLQASQRLLSGARSAGVWSADCAELADFLDAQVGFQLLA